MTALRQFAMEELNKIKSLYAEGRGIKKIATMMKIGQPGIDRALKSMGVEIRPVGTFNPALRNCENFGKHERKRIEPWNTSMASEYLSRGIA